MGCASPLSNCLKEHDNSIQWDGSCKPVISFRYSVEQQVGIRPDKVNNLHPSFRFVLQTFFNLLHLWKQMDPWGICKVLHLIGVGPVTHTTWGKKQKPNNNKCQLERPMCRSSKGPETFLELSYYGHFKQRDEAKGVVPLQCCCWKEKTEQKAAVKTTRCSKISGLKKREATSKNKYLVADFFFSFLSFFGWSIVGHLKWWSLLHFALSYFWA